ncbi:glycosyltransferase [Geodermatophilus telluris]|uniref:glycosyltransferase n=1 Tax=Geodermatophilus telluris TaxID=1190417 RepID=UPI001587CBE8|nr:glycosyltransferase [Geodermatophilus telluris]
MSPQVTVVVPARNEVSTIDTCLDSVLVQEGVTFEVVVVDNGSTDGTTEKLLDRAARDPRMTVLRHPTPSIPASLNAALGAARGTWLVRVDAHSVIPQGYLARAVARLEEGRWAGVGGRKTAVARTPAGRAIATVLNSPLAVGGSSYHYATAEAVVDHIPFGAYLTAAVRELGGWDEDVPNNEDFEFDQRIRRRGELLLDPDLEIAWNTRESLRDLFRQYRRYGRGKPLVARRHPESLHPRHVAPPLLVLWLGGSAAVSLRHPRLGGAAALAYVLAVSALGAVIARHAQPGADRRVIPAAVVAMQVGWGLGFWQGVGDLARRRR